MKKRKLPARDKEGHARQPGSNLEITLLVPPTTCIECLNPYIRTQGSGQEVCLLCQRAKEGHNYTNVEAIDD